MNPMIYGHTRVSTDGQSEVAQIRQLRATGAAKVFYDFTANRMIQAAGP
jgi:DNA invertase Pin-like site-specific DNA recombinase